MKTGLDEAVPYVTKDGSIIRELIHPVRGIPSHMSLAEALVPPGAMTFLHVHNTAEEIYYISSGKGVMTLGREMFEVREGDGILIVPGTPHCIRNTGNRDLRILCCCCPPYSDADTHILNGMKGEKTNE